MAIDQKVKRFLYESIEFMASLYVPPSSVRVLDLIRSKVNKKGKDFDPFAKIQVDLAQEKASLEDE